ncbi:hypothetical protein SHIRM173S_03947 [Streptomyces hirsutus]
MPVPQAAGSRQQAAGSRQPDDLLERLEPVARQSLKMPPPAGRGGSHRMTAPGTRTGCARRGADRTGPRPPCSVRTACQGCRRVGNASRTCPPPALRAPQVVALREAQAQRLLNERGLALGDGPPGPVRVRGVVQRDVDDIDVRRRHHFLVVQETSTPCRSPNAAARSLSEAATARTVMSRRPQLVDITARSAIPVAPMNPIPQVTSPPRGSRPPTRRRTGHSPAGSQTGSCTRHLRRPPDEGTVTRSQPQPSRAARAARSSRPTWSPAPRRG